MAQGRVRRLRQESGLLREGAALPRRSPVRRRQGARNPHRRPPGRTAGHRVPGRDEQGRVRAAEERRALARHHADEHQRHRQHHHEPQEAALRQPEGPAGRLLRDRSPGAHPGGSSGRRPGRGLHGAEAVRGVGPAREGPRNAPRIRQARGDEGTGPQAAGRGRVRAGQAAAGRDGDPGDRHLRRHGVLRGQRAEGGRHRRHPEAGRDCAVASARHAPRLPDGRQPDGYRSRRPRRELLRELRLRLAAQLQRLLQRTGHEHDRPAVAGTGREEAAGDGVGDPEEARARHRAAHARLAAGLLHDLAARQEPDPAPVDLQLRPHAGGLAGRLAPPRPAAGPSSIPGAGPRAGRARWRRGGASTGSAAAPCSSTTTPSSPRAPSTASSSGCAPGSPASA